jgi:hypothetical protein
VQAHHKKCGNPKKNPSCNEALAFQYKTDKIFISRAGVSLFSTDKPNHAYVTGSNDDDLTYMKVLKRGRWQHEITINDGSNYIKIRAQFNQLTSMVVSASFGNQLSGLCGDFDGNPKNDGVPRSDQFMDIPIPDGENLFYNCQIPLTGLKDVVAPHHVDTSYCDIHYQNTKCSSDLLGVDNQASLMKRSYVASVISKHRFASLVDVLKREDMEEPALIPFTSADPDARNAVAMSACSKFVLNKCILIMDTLDSAYDDCVEDVLALEDMNVIMEYEELAQDACYAELESLKIINSASDIEDAEIVEQIAAGELVAAAEGAAEYECPTTIKDKVCSGKGGCFKIGCDCDVGFAGTSCQFQLVGHGKGYEELA